MDTPRTTAIATEDVTFSKPIDPATFDYRALSLYLNGNPANRIDSTVTVTPKDSTNTTFTIGGLIDKTADLGSYVLTVDPTLVFDPAGNAGLGTASVTWNVQANADTTPPTSSITPFPGEVLPAAGIVHTTSFQVTWAGSDEAGGSGLKDFNIYVSDNGRPFTPWLTHTTTTSATYTGVEQHTYGFISQATDNALNQERQRTTADASVFVSIQGEIHGRVFEDINAAGTDAPNATNGLQGWTVFLDLNRDATVDSGDPTTTTLADGSFAFTGLEPGTYLVGEVVQSGWQLTYPNAGGSAVGATVIETSVTVGATNAPVYLADVMAQAKAGGTASSTAANQALIGLKQFQSDPRFSGISGQGETVAVLDSGVDTTSSYFGPIGANGMAAGIAYEYNFINNTSQANDVLGHGSVVSSIIGSHDTTNPGIAPGVRIIDLKVLDDAGNGDFGTIGRALQWVAANAAKYNIVSVNMSFGDGGNYNQPTSLYGLGNTLAQLAAENVIVVSAAGNNFATDHSTQGVAYPAADPNSLAVGAVWGSALGGPYSWSSGAVDYTTSADQIMSFSQRSATLTDTLAPGGFIQGAGPSGGVSTFSGTSMAAPTITGVAVLADQLAMETLGRRLTPSEYRYLLNITGTAVTDNSGSDNVTNTGLVFHRVNVEALAEGILGMKNGTITNVPTGPVHPSTTSSSTVSSSASGITIPPGEQSVLLLPGGSVTGIDFGNFMPGTVSGTVYFDADADGSQDHGETGQSGWTVTLHANAGGIPDQTFTTGASAPIHSLISPPAPTP